MSKMSRNYYHAGLSQIETFKINKGGLHMGGRYSALEAAARKIREMHSDEKKDARIYLHSVLVDDSRLDHDVWDCGGNELWEAQIREWQKVGLMGAKYTNRFEPDMRKSIILCSTDPIQKISRVEVLTLDEAERILEDMEQYCSVA